MPGQEAMQSVLHFIQSINQFLWSGPLLFLLMGTHLYFTMKLNFPQKNIFKAPPTVNLFAYDYIIGMRRKKEKNNWFIDFFSKMSIMVLCWE